jgi:hypothetical protein
MLLMIQAGSVRDLDLLMVKRGGAILRGYSLMQLLQNKTKKFTSFAYRSEIQ